MSKNRNFLKLALIIFFSFVYISDNYGQEKKKEKSRTSQAETENSFAPYTPESNRDNQVTSKKSSKKARKAYRKSQKKGAGYSYLKNLDKKKEEFRERMKDNAKEDRKMARLMKKPQYSDPMYFGHKRKPKKRDVDKRKLCKECGIVH
jgi:hypothetical protein